MRDATKTISKVRGDAFAAILLLSYLDIGGLIGFIVERKGTIEPMCWPRASVFGVLETECANAVLGWLWFFLTELPRLFLVVPALALALVGAGIKNGFDGHYLGEATLWMLYSIPLLIVAWLCARNWRDRNWQFATLLLAGFVAEVIHLAAGE